MRRGGGFLTTQIVAERKERGSERERDGEIDRDRGGDRGI